jgi:hypothetical protein
MPKKLINSWDQLREQISSIVSEVNHDPSLAFAASVNPLLALEELGYEIDRQSRPDIEERLRFEPRTAVRLKDLRQSIFQHAGHSFDINSPDELAEVLFTDLKLAPPARGKTKAQQQTVRPSTKPLSRQQTGAEPVKDPLEVLREAHPLVEPLLEYRRLEATRPRLAPRSSFDAIRKGKREVPVTKISGRLKTTRRDK